ncbi:MAG TPA: Bro-N domain-containing protein [Streptomyces sp.]|nr:Bro-N domain-containing protein [Streptomyces sp.]
MYEQNTRTDRSEQSAAGRQDAIGVNDFVYAATGARVRRLTLPGGTHWFPAVDVATNLGYSNTRQALLWHVAPDAQESLGDLARSVYGIDASSKIAGHGLKKSMKMVHLRGLVQLVTGCTKPECAPFKAWVAEVVATVQRDGSYSLDPAPAQPAAGGGTAYAMPQQVVDAIVRLEERNLRVDESLLAAQEERGELLRQIGRSQDSAARALHRIADSLDRVAERLQPAAAEAGEPSMTPQELLAVWQSKNLVVTGDVHAVAAYLAPALLRGGARYRLEEIAARTGLSQVRVHDCVRMLLRRGCMRQTGSVADGGPLYVLP